MQEISPELKAIIDAPQAVDQNPETDGAAFKEAVVFMPAEFLTAALRTAGHADPEAWAVGLDTGAITEEKVEHRIFHVNRALRLYMSEQKHLENNMQARQLISDGIDEDTWRALINRGVIPWLMSTLPVKKGAIAAAAREVSRQAAAQSEVIHHNEPVTAKEPDPAYFDVGQEPAREGSMDALESIQE